MKLRPNQNSTPQQTSNYVHPWYDYVDKLNKPNPPSQEAIEKAKFVDKTYQWKGGNDSVRSGNKRSSP
jgi:hypothetical protein